MAIIIPANSAADTAFSVDNSCRFNDDDSAYMHKTPSAGNVDRWTFSAWVKRGSVSTAVALIGSSPTANNNFETIGFAAAGDIDWEHYEYTSSSYKGRLKTNRLFRDPSAWYHIVAVWDSANATAGNRMRLYVNGVEETSLQSETQPSSGQDSLINSGNPQQVGASGGAIQFFDGYMAEVYFIDGTVYGPTDFGEFDEDSPTIWKPIDASGLTFGTNGFYLDFKASDNLGNDANGGTDLTEVNLAATDQCVDSPTNNFCTMSPLWNFANNVTLSEGNCKIVSSGSWSGAGATVGLAAGKWYYEVKMTSLPGGGGNGRTGFFDSEVTHTSGNIFQQTNGATFFYNEDGGEIQKDNSITTADYGQVAQGSILGVALNMDDKQVTFYDDNSAIVTNLALSTNGTSGIVIPSSGINTETQEYNFGNPSYANSSDAADANGYGAFEYAPPSGYLAICSKNLGSDGG